MKLILIRYSLLMKSCSPHLLPQKLLIIYIMNVLTLASFGKILNFLGVQFLVNMLKFPSGMF